MKKIITQQVKEEASFYSDFTGEKFEMTVPVTLRFLFGYGSKYDGADLELHLSDVDAKSILQIIKKNLHSDYKTLLKTEKEHCADNLNLAMDSRDYRTCDYYSNNLSLLNVLLMDIEE